MARRALLDQFQLPNVAYIGCSVTFYVADATGAATAVKATLYDDLTGSGTLLNPQNFNSEGALAQPTYIETAVVPVVAGAHVVSQTLGVVCPPGGARGDWATATIYLPGDIVTDGAAGTGTGDIYAVVNFHQSGTWATDAANANKLKLVFDVSALSIAPDATETAKGKAEIATQAEVNAETDDSRFVTALKLAVYTAAKIAAAISAALAATKSVTGLWSFQHTKSTVQTLTDGAAIAWDVSAGNAAKVTLTASGHTIGAPTNIQAGGFYFLAVIQDGTGSRTVNWNGAFKFGTPGTPTLTTTASKIDYFTFFSPDGAVLHCVGKTQGF